MKCSAPEPVGMRLRLDVPQDKILPTAVEISISYVNAQKAAKHALCFTRQAKSNQQAMEQRVMEYLSSEGERVSTPHSASRQKPNVRSIHQGEDVRFLRGIIEGRNWRISSSLRRPLRYRDNGYSWQRVLSQIAPAQSFIAKGFGALPRER